MASAQVDLDISLTSTAPRKEGERMIWHEDYRGYQVSYQSGDQVAWIKLTHDSDPLAEKPVAGPGEGRVELRSKAHSVIDADILARARTLASTTAESQTAHG